jgi:hydroxyacylglutathione hydrolase
MLKTFTNKDNPMVFNVNAYLLINEESHQAILIDTAMMGEAIIQFIYENNLVLTDIFITHFHFDHIATLDMLQKELHPKIHIGQKDLAFLFNPETNGTARTGVKFGLVQDDNFVAITAENEVTIDGFTIKAIPFGGHTPGTTFYVVNDEYAFVGDTLLKIKLVFTLKTVMAWCCATMHASFYHLTTSLITLVTILFVLVTTKNYFVLAKLFLIQTIHTIQCEIKARFFLWKVAKNTVNCSIFVILLLMWGEMYEKIIEYFWSNWLSCHTNVKFFNQL